ncbi:hypothetical protein [Roseovarius sp.]|uniref:hypothetical protein n=1 Tax=Roseovarius sp. TaxID=1486281 RepID=UPI003A973199
MTNPHPNLQIDLRQYCYLGEAFFCVGLAMFPDNWTGREQFAVPDVTFKHLEQERMALEKKVSRLRQQERELAMASIEGMSDAEYLALQESRTASREYRLAQEHKLFSLGETDDYQHQENAACQRRMDAEAKLIAAFKAKELDLITYGGLVVDWTTWPDKKGWSYSFPFSTISAPPSVSSMGRAIALIKRTDFDNWLLQQPFYRDTVSGYSDEERAVIWLRDLVSKNPAPQKKDAILAAMKSEFPGLSERARKRVWDVAAPASWKGPGPKSSA